jgi:four helix bundle protein
MYELAARLPAIERYGLADQIRRASRSIPAAIAEGYGRRSTPKEFCRYLSYGVGEANEMEVHLRTAALLEYISHDAGDVHVGEYRVIGKQLTSLIRYWQKRAEF